MAISDLKLEDMLSVVVDAYPSPLLIFDLDVRLLAYNQAAEPLVGPDPKKILNHRGGDVLCCVHHQGHPEGCGHTEACQTCGIRTSVNTAFDGQKVTRTKARVLVNEPGAEPREIYILVTASPFRYQDLDLALVVLEDVGQVMELRSLLPMCASCKKVRDDKDYWSKVENYIHDQLEVDISHGLCPECAEKFLGEYQDEQNS